MSPARVLLFALLLIPSIGFAAEPSSPYAGQQNRTVKALSDEEVVGLLQGEGMGLAKAAELNGYPGPAHILALANELKLSDAQRRQIQAIFERMNLSAKSLGAEIVERERALDRQFRNGEITADRLAGETAAIAELQGRLRSTHLAAHLEARPLLTSEQIAIYQQLRGYRGDMHHHHG